MIPIDYLHAWSSRGAIQQSEKTFRSIRAVVRRIDWPEGIEADAYLQGSYANKTNIRADSDVDVVIELEAEREWQTESNVEFLGLQILTLTQDHSFGLLELKATLKDALEEAYGWGEVGWGNKCLSVNTPYLGADVVPAVRYENARGAVGIQLWHEGEDSPLVNYPKLHLANGQAKSKATFNQFKKNVRIFKNAKRRLVAEGDISEDLAPSYFIECLLFNVPNSVFKTSVRDSVEGILSFLQENELERLLMQNGVRRLFGDDDDQWDVEDAEGFIDEVNDLYYDW